MNEIHNVNEMNIKTKNTLTTSSEREKESTKMIIIKRNEGKEEDFMNDEGQNKPIYKQTNTEKILYMNRIDKTHKKMRTQN